ncbi:MAG: hypothetical protein KGJ48_09440, partial [Nitrospirota bacterium]|nr:hypothetical protein [Nitrospirota bacterium]
MPTRLLIIVLLLAGCDHLAIEHRTNTNVPPRVVEFDRQPRGVAEVHMSERPAHDGWTIEVTQDYAVTTETQVREERMARRYLAWPLAPFSGLLQCPIGGLVGLVSPLTTMGYVGCHRLIGQEPLANARSISSTIERTRQTVIMPAPVSNATVTVSDPATNTILFRDTTNEHGLVTIPTYPRVDGQTSISSAVVTVGEGAVIFARRTLTPAASRGWQPPSQQQPVTWPETAIFQVQLRGTTEIVESQVIRGALQSLLLREGVCVVGPPQTMRAIQQEQGLQLVGRVSDQAPIRTGYLLAPTILITVELSQTGTERTVLVIFTNVQDSTALA